MLPKIGYSGCSVGAVMMPVLVGNRPVFNAGVMDVVADPRLVGIASVFTSDVLPIDALEAECDVF